MSSGQVNGRENGRGHPALGWIHEVFAPVHSRPITSYRQNCPHPASGCCRPIPSEAGGSTYPTRRKGPLTTDFGGAELRGLAHPRRHCSPPERGSITTRPVFAAIKPAALSARSSWPSRILRRCWRCRAESRIRYAAEDTTYAAASLTPGYSLANRGTQIRQYFDRTQRVVFVNVPADKIGLPQALPCLLNQSRRLRYATMGYGRQHLRRR
jgi:hypothetical protein